MHAQRQAVGCYEYRYLFVHVENLLRNLIAVYEAVVDRIHVENVLLTHTNTTQ